MKIIGVEVVDSVICPISELPVDAIKTVFNGVEYVIYEEGDELPIEPVYE